MAIKYVGETALNKLCSLIKSTIATLEAAIPTKTSDITNDSDYTTAAHVDELNTAMNERVTALEQGGGGGGSNVYNITAELPEGAAMDTDEMTISTPFTDIISAYNAGKTLTITVTCPCTAYSYAMKLKLPLTSVYYDPYTSLDINKYFQFGAVTCVENIASVLGMVKVQIFASDEFGTGTTGYIKCIEI